MESTLVQPPAPSTLRCVGCGYDLTGAMIGGTCSECGAPVEVSIQALRPKNKLRGVATACFWCGVISIVPIAWFFVPVTIVFYVLSRIAVRRGFSPRSSLVRANVGLIASLIGLTWFLMLLLAVGS